jgi:thymidine kinase
MKQQKKQKPYQERFDSDDRMSVGELSHHIGKKMTEKVQKSSKDFKRKPKHKNDYFDMDDD